MANPQTRDRTPNRRFQRDDTLAANVDPTTTNRMFAIPTRGSDIGTWDVPVNGNMMMLDTILGAPGNVTATAGATTTLMASDIVNGTITVSGDLSTGNAVLLFPAGISGWWSIQNLTTPQPSGTGALIVGISGGGEQIGIPPSAITDIHVDATMPTVNGGTGAVRYRNFPPLGTYLDIASGLVPNWITVSTIPPYLNCNGAAIDASLHPRLIEFLGRSTLPDFRGSTPATLDQGAGRIVASRGSVDGNTLFAFGGADSITLAAAAIPSITAAGGGTVATQANNLGAGNVALAIPVAPGGTITEVSIAAGGGGLSFPLRNGGTAYTTLFANTITATGSASVTTTSNNTAGGPHVNMQPTTILGLRLIRAA